MEKTAIVDKMISQDNEGNTWGLYLIKGLYYRFFIEVRLNEKTIGKSEPFIGNKAAYAHWGLLKTFKNGAQNYVQ